MIQSDRMAGIGTVMIERRRLRAIRDHLAELEAAVIVERDVHDSPIGRFVRERRGRIKRRRR